MNESDLYLRDSNISDIKDKEKKSQTLIIVFITTSQYAVQISIDFNKRMKDLFKNNFKIIKKQNLFGDESIRFMKNGKFIPHNSNDLVMDHFKRKMDGNVIMIDDVEGKINSAFVN